MHLYPRLDVVGNIPVRLVYACPSNWWAAAYTTLVPFVMCGSSSTSSSGVVTFFFSRVLLTFFLVWLRCPLIVASDCSRYFLTCCAVSVGHVTKFPASMDFMNVDGRVDPAAACSYYIAPCTLFISYTLVVISSLLLLYLFPHSWFLLSNGTVHNPVDLSLCPSMSTLPCTVTSPSNSVAFPSLNKTWYPASHICPHDNKEWVSRPFIMWADQALWLKLGIAKSAVTVDSSFCPSSSLMWIGICSRHMLVQYAPRFR
jgi:hypothetical protein